MKKIRCFASNFKIMIFPIRCFTCNKIISDKWNEYNIIIESGKTPDTAFKSLNIRLYCCKRMFLGHVELIDKIVKYSNT